MQLLGLFRRLSSRFAWLCTWWVCVWLATEPIWLAEAKAAQARGELSDFVRSTRKADGVTPLTWREFLQPRMGAIPLGSQAVVRELLSQFGNESLPAMEVLSDGTGNGPLRVRMSLPGQSPVLMEFPRGGKDFVRINGKGLSAELLNNGEALAKKFVQIAPRVKSVPAKQQGSRDPASTKNEIVISFPTRQEWASASFAEKRQYILRLRALLAAAEAVQMQGLAEAKARGKQGASLQLQAPSDLAQIFEQIQKHMTDGAEFELWSRLFIAEADAQSPGSTTREVRPAPGGRSAPGRAAAPARTGERAVRSPTPGGAELGAPDVNLPCVVGGIFSSYGYRNLSEDQRSMRGEKVRVLQCGRDANGRWRAEIVAANEELYQRSSSTNKTRCKDTEVPCNPMLYKVEGNTGCAPEFGGEGLRTSPVDRGTGVQRETNLSTAWCNANNPEVPSLPLNNAADIEKINRDIATYLRPSAEFCGLTIRPVQMSDRRIVIDGALPVPSGATRPEDYRRQNCRAMSLRMIALQRQSLGGGAVVGPVAPAPGGGSNGAADGGGVQPPGSNSNSGAADSGTSGSGTPPAAGQPSSDVQPPAQVEDRVIPPVAGVPPSQTGGSCSASVASPVGSCRCEPTGRIAGDQCLPLCSQVPRSGGNDADASRSCPEEDPSCWMGGGRGEQAAVQCFCEGRSRVVSSPQDCDRNSAAGSVGGIKWGDAWPYLLGAVGLIAFIRMIDQSRVKRSTGTPLAPPPGTTGGSTTGGPVDLGQEAVQQSLRNLDAPLRFTPGTR